MMGSLELHSHEDKSRLLRQMQDWLPIEIVGPVMDTVLEPTWSFPPQRVLQKLRWKQAMRSTISRIFLSSTCPKNSGGMRQMMRCLHLK